MSQESTDGGPLVDSFGRIHDYLRLSLTDRCNLRCVYCMPEEGVNTVEKSEILTFEEIHRLVRIFVRLGVKKVRLTGGEPTVRRGLVDLVTSIKQIPGVVHLLMTTNGLTLQTDAEKFKSAGLTGVNISLDTLREDRFEDMTRRPGLQKVVNGIDAAIRSGIKTKINVVVLPGKNDDELCDFVEFVRDREAQVRFIEFMPFAGNLWKPEKVFGYSEMRITLESRYSLVPIPGERTDVAKDFAVQGAKGTVGFVTSVTDSFCAGCNRVRVTADGRFKTRLFLPTQTSLRDMIRQGESDDDISGAVRADLLTKWREHPPMDRWLGLDSLSMVQIGG